MLLSSPFKASKWFPGEAKTTEPQMLQENRPLYGLGISSLFPLPIVPRALSFSFSPASLRHKEASVAETLGATSSLWALSTSAAVIIYPGMPLYNSCQCKYANIGKKVCSVTFRRVHVMLPTVKKYRFSMTTCGQNFGTQTRFQKSPSSDFIWRGTRSVM